MSVYKPQKSRYWHYDFQYQGSRFHGSTGQERKGAALEVERRKRRAASLGEMDPREVPTLQQACSTWWTETGQHLRTADDVWNRIKIVLRLIGKDVLVTEIEQSAVNRAVQRRRSETYSKAKPKKGVRPKRYAVAPATVNADIVGILRRVLRHVAKDKRIKPLLQEIAWGELRLDEPEPYLRIYSPAQRAAWRGECDEVASFALDMLLSYGLRFGELFFPPSAYHPASDVGDAFLLIDKRKKQLMVLPLRDDDARQIAARAGRANAAGLGSIWLEQAPGGKLAEVSYHGLHSRLLSAAARAGLTMPSVIHGTRHHAGTMMLKRTQNLKSAQQLLGHANIASTMRYAHVLTGDLKAALEQESRNSPEAPAGGDEFTPPKQRRRR